MKMELCLKKVSKLLKVSEERVRKVIMNDTFVNEYGSVELKNGGAWYSYGTLFKNHVNSKLHSVDDEPSFISRDIESEFLWHSNDLLHRETKFKNGKTKPARVIYYNEDEYVLEWYKNNELHNSDKDEKGNLLPAVIDTSENIVEYWIDGNQVESGFKFAGAPKINMKELGIENK